MNVKKQYLLSLALACACVLPCVSSAQQAAGGGDSAAGIIALRSSPKINNRNNWTMRTPSDFGGGTKREWGVFTVEFATAPLWIDELVVNYTILCENKRDPKTPFSLYTLTVRYHNIEKANDHKVAAVILPNSLKRFGDPIGIHVEMIADGKSVDLVDDVNAPFLKSRAGWWKDPAIINSDKLVKREGQMVDRSKTPIGLTRVDDYEVSRP